LDSSATRVNPEGQVWLTCIASDPKAGTLSYEWSATGGSFATTARQVMTWIAPNRVGAWSVSVTVRNSRGHIATESVTIEVVENRPPSITSLYAEDNLVVMGESTAITCVTADPDGDAIVYSWRTDGGELSGVGSTVTWFAPYASQETEYQITVVADDSHGGADLREITLSAVRIMVVPDDIFVPVARESGTVRSDGTEKGDIMRAGDDADNRGYRAFWSYDLSRLRGTNVAWASLQFTTQFISASHELDRQGVIESEPLYKLWTQLGGLRISQVSYKTNGLPGYEPQHVLDLTASALFEAPAEVDVTALVQNIANGTAAGDRLQVMAAFQRDTNPNMFPEYITWATVVLNVMHVPE